MSSAGINTIRGKGSDGGPAYVYEYRADKNRMIAKYIGVWDEATAKRALADFRTMLTAVSSRSPKFTLLDDFTAFGSQPKETTEVNSQFDAIARSFGITRNALVVPDGNIRRELRHTLQDFYANRIFVTFEEAETWLSEIEP